MFLFNKSRLGRICLCYSVPKCPNERHFFTMDAFQNNWNKILLLLWNTGAWELRTCAAKCWTNPRPLTTICRDSFHKPQGNWGIEVCRTPSLLLVCKIIERTYEGSKATWWGSGHTILRGGSLNILSRRHLRGDHWNQEPVSSPVSLEVGYRILTWEMLSPLPERRILVRHRDPERKPDQPVLLISPSWPPLTHRRCPTTLNLSVPHSNSLV